MRKDRQKASKLRLGGKSYAQIRDALGVPKSTLSGWFSELELSKEAKEKILKRSRIKSLDGLLKRNINQTMLAKKRRDEIRSTAKAELKYFSKHDLFVTGVSLYWAEGYKRPVVRNGRELTHHVVSLTNSDLQLINLFLRFLREICNVPEEKIYANLRIFEHQNERNLLNYWSGLTKIPKQRFDKVYKGISKSSLGKKPYNSLPYGTIQIRVGDTKLFHKIMGWIDGMKQFS